MARAKAGQNEDREAFAKRPETIGKLAAKAPQTGEEYLAISQGWAHRLYLR